MALAGGDDQAGTRRQHGFVGRHVLENFGGDALVMEVLWDGRRLAAREREHVTVGDDSRIADRDEFDGASVAVCQSRAGYGMLKVRTAPDGDEYERYSGFEMALDHAAEVLGVGPEDLPIPDEAADMGM